jgi:hypothetical protein
MQHVGSEWKVLRNKFRAPLDVCSSSLVEDNPSARLLAHIKAKRAGELNAKAAKDKAGPAFEKEHTESTEVRDCSISSLRNPSFRCFFPLR